MSQGQIQETGSMSKLWTIRRWASEEDYLQGREYKAEEARELFGGREQVTQFKHNVLLNEGINELWTILCSAGGTKFDNTNAYLGVGDSSTAASATDTGLVAATNKYYQGMDVGFPTFGTSQKATWRATFASGDANFSWQEFTVGNADSNGAINLNRKVDNQGTKTAGQVWELSLEITIS